MSDAIPGTLLWGTLLKHGGWTWMIPRGPFQPPPLGFWDSMYLRAIAFHVGHRGLSFEKKHVILRQKTGLELLLQLETKSCRLVESSSLAAEQGSFPQGTVRSHLCQTRQPGLLLSQRSSARG